MEFTVKNTVDLEAEIDSDVEERRTSRKKVLRALVTQAKVERTGKGGKGDPYRYAIKDAGVCGSPYTDENQGTINGKQN